jgi:alpha-ketoglutarate-dependent taurine dioxygenase
LGHESAAFDLSVLAEERDDGAVDAVFRYDSERFDRGVIERLGAGFEQVLRQAVERPDERLREFERSVRPRGPSPMERPSAIPNLESLKRMPAVRRSFSGTDLVRSHAFAGGLPLVVTPQVTEIDGAAWVAANRPWVDARLLEHGGVLFRNFRVSSPAGFDAFARASCQTLIEYGERSSPRTAIHGRIYSSTEHPASEEILLHCEQSYTLEWPTRILFCCLEPAARGGRTPLAAIRQVTSAIPPSVLEEFSHRGVMYVRNYGGGVGLSWQEAFQTDDRDAVNAYCERMAIDVEWLDDIRLRTRQVRAALRPHPVTGEMLWFNHALFFHVSSLKPATRDSIVAGIPEGDWPQNTYYGDGGPIADQVLDRLRDAYSRSTVRFDWERGDVLLLDNMLVAHGREAFEGPRRIAAALGDPYRALDYAQQT